MKHLFFVATLCVALVFMSACSGTTTNTNTNKAPAATPASTPATAAASPASQGAAQDFTLVNKTGVEIHAVHIAPHDVDDWEEDILGRDTLPDGETVDIKFNRTETAENWDMRIEDSKGNAIEWENLNLLKISKVTLFYENGKARAEVE